MDMKINPIRSYNDYMKVSTKNRASKVDSSDSVEISKEALELAETRKIIDMVMSAPDVRTDKVAEVSQKLNDPNYINDTLLGGVADKIMDLFKI